MRGESWIRAATLRSGLGLGLSRCTDELDDFFAALRNRVVLGVCGVNEDVDEEADDDGREMFRAADAVDDVLTDFAARAEEPWRGVEGGAADRLAEAPFFSGVRGATLIASLRSTFSASG